MTPSKDRLLAGVQQVCDQIHAGGDDFSRNKAKTAEILLRWIAGACDLDFLARHYQEGGALLAAFHELSGHQGDPRVSPSEVNANLPGEVLEGQLTRLAAELADSTRAILQSGGHAAQAAILLRRVALWEISYYEHRARVVESEGANSPMRIDQISIQSYLRRRVPNATDVMVLEARPVVGGYGRATVMIHTDRPIFGVTQMVMRAEVPVTILTLRGFSIVTESEILRIACAEGIPAPEPLLVEDSIDNEVGVRFLLVRKMPGSNYGSFLEASRPISDALLVDLVSGLARIHAINLARHSAAVAKTHLVDWLEDKTISDSVARWVDLWESFWRGLAIPSPTLERTFHWLRTNVPRSDEAPILLHSDFGLGNLLIEDDRVSGVLDWEAAHLGDPAEEVAWLIQNLSGKFDRQRVLDLYQQATGRQILETSLSYFDVFSRLKLAVSGLSATAKLAIHSSSDPILAYLASLAAEPALRGIGSLLDQFTAYRD